MPAETYRKKPVTIQALQWSGRADQVIEIIDFVGYPDPKLDVPGFLLGGYHDMAGTDSTQPVLWVAANDAWLNVEPSEWIAKDRHGFYPIKSDVFQDSYEWVDTDGPCR